MATTRNERHAHIAKRAHLRCELERCCRPVYGLSRFCRSHRRQYDGTGAAGGTGIRIGELTPFIKASRRFIERNRSHPGIQSAMDWVRRLIEEASRLPKPRHPTQTNSPDVLFGPHARFLRMHWNGPEDCLAVVFAVFALRQYSPHRFVNDRHFRCQLAGRFLRLPHRVVGVEKPETTRLPMRLRIWLGSRIDTSLAMLADRTGAEVVKSFGHTKTLSVPDRPSHQDAPFATEAA